MKQRTRWIAACFVTLGLVSAACGGDDSDDTSSPATSATSATTSAESGTTAAGSATTEAAEHDHAEGEEHGDEGAMSDTVLRLVSTYGIEAVPDVLSYDIQMEPAHGNAEFLMRPTLTGPEPWLAESVEQLDDTTWRVTLHDGITFQNGNPLDAEALKAWFEYYDAVEGQAENPALIGSPSGYEVSGPLSVDITTPEPFPNMAYGLAHYVYPVFDAATVLAADGDFASLVDKGIYTGPYMWESIEPGKITYTANMNYWQGMPALAGVEISVVADEQAALQAIAAGEADMFGYPSLATASATEGMDGVNFVTSGYDVSFVGLAIEPKIAPFDDVRVRQAAAMAIDTDAITEGVGFGLAVPMHGWFDDTDPRNVAWMEDPDVAGAEALLDEAGWVKGDDGIRSKDGTTLDAKFYAYSDTIEALATAAAEMLRDVGFNATVQRFESYADIQPVQSVEGGIYTVNTENYGLNGDPLGSFNLAMSPDYSTPGYPDVKEILAPALSSSDPAVVDQALVDAQQLVADQAYWIPVMAPGGRFIVSDAYSSYEPSPFYLWIDWKLAPSA